MPLYYIHQSVHHDTRQRWASQLLEQLALILVGGGGDDRDDTDTSAAVVDEVVADPRFSRLVLAASMPFPQSQTTTTTTTTKSNNNNNNNNNKKKQTLWIWNSLQALLALIGRRRSNTNTNTNDDDSLPTETITGIQQLIDRACQEEEDNGYDYPLHQACSVLWAIQGLQARIPQLTEYPCCPGQDRLTQRVLELPFQIIPCGIDWNDVMILGGDNNEEEDDNNNNKDDDDTILSLLLKEIPFGKETIVTRGGTNVQERRGTAWLAAPGIGALAYSGKLMEPHTPIPPVVQRVLQHVESRLFTSPQQSQSQSQSQPLPFFDCVLCNHYADATAACKFHTDPEHGSHWDRTTVVVAAGSDRKFAFKPIVAWPTSTTDTDNDNDNDNDSNNGNNDKQAAVTHLFSGDLVVMTDNCNDDYYHAVHAGMNNHHHHQHHRVSLVLKRAIDRGGGQKGHGLQGQGRRSRRRKQQPSQPQINSKHTTTQQHSSQPPKQGGHRAKHPAKKRQHRTS